MANDLQQTVDKKIIIIIIIALNHFNWIVSNYIFQKLVGTNQVNEVRQNNLRINDQNYIHPK